MTAQDATELLKQGGILAAAVLVISALMTGRLVTKREFDKLQAQYDSLEKVNTDANVAIRQQSETNARLVERLFAQQEETERARRAPAIPPDIHPHRRETDREV